MRLRPHEIVLAVIVALLVAVAVGPRSSTPSVRASPAQHDLGALRSSG